MPPANPSSNPPTRRGFVDPKALMAIRSLELRARIVVEGFWNGLHRSPYYGFSVEFTEYRPYTPGDDTRYLDWRLYARSDRYYLKRFQDETNLRCHLLVDRSASMLYGSEPHTKLDYARTLAATLAWFLHGQGDAIGLFTFDSQVRDYLPARHRQGHLRQLLIALESGPEGTITNLEEPLRRAAELVRKRGLVILISDLLAPIDQLERNLGHLAAAGHEMMIFQVMDPREMTFDFQQPLVLEELENRRELYLDPNTARADYLSRFTRHNETLETMCRKLGIVFQRVLTNQPLELALLELLRSRTRSGKRASRRNQQHAK